MTIFDFDDIVYWFMITSLCFPHIVELSTYLDNNTYTKIVKTIFFMIWPDLAKTCNLIFHWFDFILKHTYIARIRESFIVRNWIVHEFWI